jgi:hypothetical protein
MTTVRVTIDAAAVSPAQAITAAAQDTGLLILSGRTFNELLAELGGLEAAMQHLLCTATTTNRPIGVNVECGGGESSTAFVAPRSWTQERLRGWVAGHHEAIEALFGEAVPMMEKPE